MTGQEERGVGVERVFVCVCCVCVVCVLCACCVRVVCCVCVVCVVDFFKDPQEKISCAHVCA